MTNNVLRYDGATEAFLDVFVPAGSGGLLTPFGLEFSPVAVPEPASILLMAAGVAGVVAARGGI